MPVYCNELHQHSCPDYTGAFHLEAFELAFTTGPHFVSCCFCGESPWRCSLQLQAEARIKNTSAPRVCCWFDKSSTPAEGEDTEVVATARGHLSGFAQRNLKHLNLFDHNLNLEEATIYSHVGMVPILWQTLPHPHSSLERLNGRITTRLHLILALLKASFHLAAAVKQPWRTVGCSRLFPNTFIENWNHL